MSVDVQARRRRTTEELISQIEGCLTERLARKPISVLHHPVPSLVPQIPRLASNSSANFSNLSPPSEGKKFANSF